MNHLTFLQCKALKAAGVDFEKSEWVYPLRISMSERQTRASFKFRLDTKVCMSCPTAEEMAERLPDEIIFDDNTDYIYKCKKGIRYRDKKWIADWISDDWAMSLLLVKTGKEIKNKDLTTALCKALLWAQQEGYMEGKE